MVKVELGVASIRNKMENCLRFKLIKDIAFYRKWQ